MSECTRWEPMLLARPGELSPGDAAALERHLDGCVACRAERATFLATGGLLAEGLLARANARDFRPFTDAVMARVERRHRRTGRVFDWVSHHRVRAALSALVPTLAAAAVVVYLHAAAEPTPLVFEMTADGGVTTVIKTDHGPIVLLDDDDEEGT